MPNRAAAWRAFSGSLEAIATTSDHSPRCMAGITLAVPILAVLRIPQRTFLRMLNSLSQLASAERYHTSVNRRTLLSAAAGAVLGQAASLPIIDTHIHLFDPTRPQGVPWPAKDNKVLYQPALPDRYRKIAVPLGIVGAIEVEASPWLEDNQWVLDVAAKDTIVVGTVGDLEPGKPEFRKHLERFHRNPLFRGIRYGNLWGRNMATELSKPEFIADIKALADAGLELDTANQNPALIADVIRLTDRVPNLRVVIDHLLRIDLPADAAV